ncbi:Formate/glycerate dehydrogenase catalytic domain-like protein [Viridothelium virens]|uniref:Saccharopine dehydrogenase [NAD(+), L-lysine-forming] n=1 Tax=Viridothelium virens TaxID=1048519 RepID=A0A6A6HGA3_VIRVR|nr:Formate/glycerate dehydrogenase catalytic domain-like protein [Viridothelium virens]
MAAHNTLLHLRTESGKPLEHRSAITPSTAKALIDDRYILEVEKSDTESSYHRIFADDEFEAVGAKLVPENSWPESNAIIIGLKELPEEEWPISHRMIHFAHCYKGQSGWEKVLSRFPRGGGTLYDLEFLQDETGRRVAAFGYHAGFAGAAVALKAWNWQLSHSADEPFPEIAQFTDGRGYYRNEDELVAQLRQDVLAGEKAAGRKPRAMIMGALGRCGRGACDLLLKAGLPSGNLIKWDLDETRDNPGPYQEIVDSDIFINAIYLTEKIPPFVDFPILDTPSRKLRVVCDVSCDPNSVNNPLPIYTDYTSFTRPTIPVKQKIEGPPLSVISIDHLPSLLPREASEAFSNALLPSLLQLKDIKTARVWSDAEKLFREKCGSLPNGTT